MVDELAELLDKAGIPYVIKRRIICDLLCYPVARPDPNCVLSTFEGWHDLEIMGLLTPDEEEVDEVVDGLSVEEVFNRIKKHWEGQ